MRIALLSAWLLLLPGLAQAQTVCDPKKTDCGCERNWGCWELLYTTKGTLFGVKGTATNVWGGGRKTIDAGVLAAYATEHYGTRRELTGHFLAFGAIGGGTADTEGSVGGALDFGYRVPLTELSGLFLRAGPSGMLLGHHHLRLSLLEPIESRIGYQLLDGDRLIESGLTFGPVVAGHFDVPGLPGPLGGSAQLRSYVALRFSALRIDASLAYVRTPSAVFAPGAGVALSRLAACGYPRPIVVCVELLYATRASGIATRGLPSAPTLRAFYSGLSVGLTP
ncbi:MAG TPA: hypothetical protein VHM19_13355 [Polyangiales bacterium]|jgi:hypothetical protein|nr:hypothetical protein [Polyangiales bacterium]